MRLALSGLIAALALGGCQTTQTGPREPPSTAYRASAHPGDTVVSVVGTPFLWVVKSVACVATVAIAAPVAGISALSESPFAPEVQRSLGDGVSANCGPPWVLHRYRTVAMRPMAEPRRVPEQPYAPAPEQPWLPGPGAPKPLFPE